MQLRLVLMFSLIFVGSVTRAGTVLEIKRIGLDVTHQESTINVSVQDGKLRVDYVNPQRSHIIRGPELWLLDSAANSYAVVTLSAKRQQAPTVKVVATTRSKIALNQSCQIYQVKVDGDLVREQCVIGTGAIAGGAELTTMMQRYRELTHALKLQVSGAQDVFDWGVSYVPNTIALIDRKYMSGRAVVEYRVNQTRLTALSNRTFEIPRGMQRLDAATLVARAGL